MKIAQLSTPELLAYSTIFENIIHTNLEIQREMNNAVQQGFSTVEELNKLMHKSVQAKEEADEKYAAIQKELDDRMKRDLGLKFGIRRSQTLINEFDSFVKNKNKQFADQIQQQETEAKRIADETDPALNTLKKVEDDSSE